ncbi:MAG: hypothetical protein GEU80_15560 [Dehalococcoidia bacterium]|nr:hypothetical protein [Dehalococcoidia bacterium]
MLATAAYDEEVLERTSWKTLRARIEALPPIARQFVAYGTVGALTTSLDAGLFAVAVAVLDLREGAAPTIASTASYMVAAAVAYVLNSRVAFREQHQGDSLATLVRFALTFATSALLAAGVFALGHSLLGSSGLALMTAKGAAIVTIILWNFTLLRLWVFRVRTGVAPSTRGPNAG